MAMPQGETWIAIKPKIAPVDRKLIPEHRDLFWHYVHERYRIYRKRKKGKKFPWTKDPILSEYHFTNTFRLYDSGTQWLLNNIGLESGTMADNLLIVWRVAQYRWPNYHSLFEEHGWIPPKFKKKEWLKKIEATKKARGKWHTSAHIVLQSNFKQSRAENYMHYMGLLTDNLPRFYKGIVEAESMEQAHRHVKSFQGFGDFTAQEVLIDLCLLGVIPDEWRDEWAVAGPGAKEGIDLIYPQAHLSKTAGYTKAMLKLRNNQRAAEGRLGLPAIPRLTTHDIEFCLCEFSKYIKIKHGTGRGRRYRYAGSGNSV